MIGSVYCVLFTDGTLKAGFTAGEQHKRVRAHVQAGKSFGKTLQMIFFTEQHSGADKTEVELLKWLRKWASSRTNEYFEGVSLDLAREAMLSTGHLVAWANKAETVNGNFLVCPGTLVTEAFDNTKSVAEKIISLVGRAGQKGITEGVIQNRFRKLPVPEILEDLVKANQIILSESVHSRSRSVIKKYHLCSDNANQQ